MVTLPTITAIIPSKDRPNGVISLVRNLRQQNYPQDKLEIIVIDDGSQPAYQLASDNVKLIRHEKSLGAQSSRNEGISQTTNDLILLLDDDIELVDRDFLSKATDVLQNNIDVAAVFGAKTDVLLDHTTQKEIEYSISKPSVYSGDLIPTTSTGGPIDWGNQVYLARREIVESCGGFDAIYGLNGGHSFREESDLHARIRKQGYVLWFSPEISYRHQITSSGGHGPSVAKRLYWIAHNHMIFLKRHLRFWPLRAIGYLVDVFRYSWVQGHLRHTLSMLRGYLAGWRDASRDKGPGQNPWLERL